MVAAFDLERAETLERSKRKREDYGEQRQHALTLASTLINELCYVSQPARGASELVILRCAMEYLDGAMSAEHAKLRSTRTYVRLHLTHAHWRRPLPKSPQMRLKSSGLTTQANWFRCVWCSQ